MIDQLKRTTLENMEKITSILESYVKKDEEEKEFFFLQFHPQLTISTLELMQVMSINNVVFLLYKTVIIPGKTFFVDSETYYKLLPPSLISSHFRFIESKKMSTTDAYDHAISLDSNVYV